MTTASINHTKQPRMQLSDQLDRLDSILDGLSENLNAAVADAARDGIRLACKEALLEILTNADLRSTLHQATAPTHVEQPEPAPQPKVSGWWAQVKARASQAAASVGRLAGQVIAGAADTVHGIARVAAEGVQSVRGLGSVKKLLLVAGVAGSTLAVASLLAPHAVAAAVCGLSGAVAATAVQLGVWTRRAYRAFTTT
jgi:hypothetical protein